MPTLDAYRLINISYAGGKNRMDDLSIDLEGHHTIVVIPNGSGKTYSITLLLQTILPGSTLGSRTFEDTFSNIRGTAHILTTHNLDHDRGKLCVGFTVNTEGSLRYFNWCFETGNSMHIGEIPLVSDGVVLSYDETREWLKSLPFERKSRLFNQGERRKLSAHLNTYGIFTDEWDMMCRMNQNEGGIKEIFDVKSRKSTDDLLSEFVIPALQRELKGIEEVDQVQAAFLKKIETLKMIPKWEERIHRMDDYLAMYQIQLDKLKRLYDREEDFRIELYILKLLNEKATEKLNAFHTLSDQLEKRTAAEEKGLLLLKKREQQLYYAHTQYKLKQVEAQLNETLKQIATFEKTLKTYGDQQKCNLALDELETYLTETARYDVIRRKLEMRQAENTRLKQDMKILESKLHGYYQTAIKQKGNELTATAELINTAEMEKDDFLLKLSSLSMKRDQLEKEKGVLRTADEAVEKLGGIERLTLTQTTLLEKEHLTQEKNEELSKTKELIESQKEPLNELEKEAFGIKAELQNSRKQLEEFHTEKEKLSQILKLFHQQRPDELLDTLKDREDEIRTQILSEKSERSRNEEVVEYCRQFNTLPPNGTIRKLITQLKKTGFHDFIAGYDYIRENESVQNPLLEYGLICENLNELSQALQKTEKPDWPVFIFSREDIRTHSEPIAAGILKGHQLIIETEFLSYSDGKLSIETYIQEKSERIRKLDRQIQGNENRQNELSLYRKIADQFIDQYGIDIVYTENRLREAFTTLNTRWNDCCEKIKGVEQQITENKNSLSEIHKAIKTLETEIGQSRQILEDFETVQKRCFHLVEALELIPDALHNTERQIKTCSLEITDQQITLQKQKEQLKRLSKKNQTLTEEFAVLKQKQKQYQPAAINTSLFSYAGEPVKALEEKLAVLKLKFEDSQLMDEEKRIRNRLVDIEKKIIHYGYTVEELKQINRTDLPGYDECSEQINLISQEIYAVKTRFGEGTSEKRQLQKIMEEITLSDEDKAGSVAVNDSNYAIQSRLNSQRLKKMTEFHQKNSHQLEHVTRAAHQIELLVESQNAFLSTYQLPEKTHIKNLDPNLFMMNEKEAWQKRQHILLQLQQSCETDRKIVESGWHTIRKTGGSESLEMSLSLAMVMEGEGGNILFDYQKIRTLFEQDSQLMKNARKMLELNIAKNSEEMNTLVENAYRSVECYINEFNNLSKFSKIETHGKRDMAVKFVFPELTREAKTGNLQRYIHEILKQVHQIEKDRMETFVRKNFSVKRLIEEMHRQKTVLKVYKPSITAGWHYEDWDNVIKWSGGEQFFAFFLIYASMSIWIRQKRTRSNRNKTVLIADNPFGQAISEHIFNPLLEFMTDNKIQFLTFTAIKDRETLALFPNKYSLVLQENHDKSSLRIQPGFFMEDL
ncbi:MAG TPA: hypothetical protein PK466_13620 [Thermotogota bacterium]|nr:hypothetical protein [Thermotogota bacterium]